MNFKPCPSALLRSGLRLLSKPFVAASRNVAGSIRCVQTTEPVAALTFDDGPHPEDTPRVLDILSRHGAKATFFMIGELAKNHSHLVHEVAKAGHAIGNHSWSHLSFPLLTRRERREQIHLCENVLKPYGEKLFRPPYSHQTPACRWDTFRLGYRVVAFSVHVEDWLDRDEAWMADQLVARIRPGSIVILHDNIYRSVLPNAQHDRTRMLSALDEALTRMTGRWRFATVPELMEHGAPVLDHWFGTGTPELQRSLRHYLLAQRQEGRA